MGAQLVVMCACGAMARRTWHLLGMAFGTALSVHAAAQEPKDTGVEFAIRSGITVPFGKVAEETSDIGDRTSAAIPLWVDLGYRITPHVMIGAYGEYALGINARAPGCDEGGVSCSTHDVRVGAQVHYHFRPSQEADPWLGAGFGYEWLTFSAAAQREKYSTTVRGFEFVNLQAGIDLMVIQNPRFGLGPFLSVSVAEFSDASCSGPGVTCEFASDKSLHEWLTLGIRAALLL